MMGTTVRRPARPSHEVIVLIVSGQLPVILGT
jgi:hypothetical protein